MSDIVERLRTAFAEDPNIEELGEAADEIDRLRADNEFLKDGIEKHVEQGIRLGERAEKAEAENDRLREALETIVEDAEMEYSGSYGVEPEFIDAARAALAKEGQ